MPLQRLAGQLAARCHGLGRGHVGSLCDALTAAGIDPEQWTARQLADALDADMRLSGWSWPDRIERPGGFLAARLRRMLTRRSSGGTAADQDTNTTTPTPTPPRYTPEPLPVLTDAQRARIDQVRAAIREHFTARTRSRTAPRPPVTPPRRAVVATPTTLCASTNCITCGVADAPRRPFLPARRAHVCDACWTSADPLPKLGDKEIQKHICKDVCESLHVRDRMPL
ncbi:hypothetical protein [Mycolicibacterium sp. 120270]|uniref:hypothetical protein n=1 Tax=Mycolicibacterium sp. 120270 TaxID=3090600 RepID=UPI00299E1081|nr:hypothetical protein [Mycolicibacterium sp. 120270]MDX1887908.1 hypothetical protein [Mycolicibacterium sp. 120270]